MDKEKEFRINRRGFLAKTVALGISAFISACQRESPLSSSENFLAQPTVEPTKVSTQTPTIEKPTVLPTPKPTELPPTPEVKHIAGLDITQLYLKQTFFGVDGEKTLNNGQGEEITLIAFGQNYVSQSWGEEAIDFTKLSENPVSSLRYLVSLRDYQGEEGIFSFGKQGEEIVFPQLANLSLPRLTLEKVPTEIEQKSQEYKKEVIPQGFPLRSGTQMTVVGLINNEESDYALVAFTDPLRSSEEGILHHYFALLSNSLLANFLEINDYKYDVKTKTIIFLDKENKKETFLELNKIQGEKFVGEISKAVGLYFVDRTDEELIKNPVVPYPAEMPSIWDIKEGENEEGNFELVLRSRDPEGNFQDFSRAKYNEEENSWNWEKIVPPELISYQTVYDNIFTFPGWNQEPVASVDSEGRINIINSVSYLLYVRNENLSFSLNGDFKVQFALRARGIGNPDQQQAGEIMFYGTPMANNPSWFGIGISENNRIISFVYDSAKKERTYLLDERSNISASESGSLSVLFEGVKSGKGEKMIVYDDQGNEMARKELPFPIFSQNLYFSLNLFNSTQDPKGVQMTVDYLRLLSPQGTENVVKK